MSYNRILLEKHTKSMVPEELLWHMNYTSTIDFTFFLDVSFCVLGHTLEKVTF